MKSEYVRKYREMDRDCALLSRYQTQEGEERQGLFIPDDERMSRLWGRWEQLNEGVEKLEEPDAVFSLVKHHFQDFLESFAYTLRDTQEHPEYTYLSLHWEIENVSRLNRHPDQERCEELTKSLKERCESREEFLNLIRSRHSQEELSHIAGEFVRESRMVEEYRADLKKFFPTFSDEQMESVKGALEEIRVVLSSMAGELTDGVEKQEERKNDD